MDETRAEKQVQGRSWLVSLYHEKLLDIEILRKYSRHSRSYPRRSVGWLIIDAILGVHPPRQLSPDCQSLRKRVLILGAKGLGMK